jgi:hypothetical protein
LHKGDLESLRNEIEHKQSSVVAAANLQAVQSVKGLKDRKNLSATSVAQTNTAQPLLVDPRIDGIHNLQPTYSPGMYIVILGAHFNTYHYETTNWLGIKTTQLSPPSVLMKYKYGKNKVDKTATLEVITEGQYTSTSEILLVKFPDDLADMMDQPVQLYVESGPPTDRRRSSEVMVQFKARRALKTVTANECSVVVCSRPGESCDGGGYHIDRLDFCNTTNPYHWSSEYGYEWQKIGGFPIRSVHSNDECPSGDVVGGIDIYTVNVFNDHRIASIQGDFATRSLAEVGKAALIEPMLVEVTNQKAWVRVLYYLWGWHLIYGIEIVLEGPAGVPFNEDWGRF